MKNMKKLKLLLPALAVAIALMASAFTYSPNHATVVTSYFANESHASGGVSIGASVPSGYSRVTPAVVLAGLTAYLNAHCPGPATPVCTLTASGTSGNPQVLFTVTAMKNGTWQ